MFGLSMREKLTALILQRSKDCIPQYIEDMKYSISQSEDSSDEQMEAKLMNIRKNYLDAVTSAVFADLKNMSLKGFYRAQLASVSYTHLDVYKRQINDFSASNCG